MPLSYSIETPDGEKSTLSSQDVANQFAQQGYENVSISPDGGSFSYDLNGQTYDGRIDEALAGLGHKVGGVAPMNADESFVQPAWRAGLQALPQDNMVRKAYIESKIRGMGLDGEVVGNNDEWYFHNPKTGKWYATTNAKGFDISDIANAGAAAPQVIGGVVGGALGGGAGAALGGVGAIGGGALGAAGGDLAGRTLTKAMASRLDPDIEAAYGGQMGAITPGADDLKDAALSGAFGGIAGAPALSKILNFGALTAAGKPAGAVLEAGGTLANKVGGTLADSQLARQVGTAFVPGLNVAQNAGLALRAGELLPWLNKVVGRGGSKVAESAERAIVKGGLSAEEQALAEGIRDVGARTSLRSKSMAIPKTLEDAAPFRLNRKIFGGNSTAQRDAVEQGAEELALNRGETRALYENIGSRLDNKRNVFLQKAEQRAEQSADPTRYMEIARSRAGKGVGGAFDKAGRVAEAGSRFGRAIEGAAENVTGAGFRGIQGAGLAAEKGGAILKGGARFLQPWENRMYLNRAVNEADELGGVGDLMRRQRRTPAFSQ